MWPEQRYMSSQIACGCFGIWLKSAGMPSPALINTLREHLAQARSRPVLLCDNIPGHGSQGVFCPATAYRFKTPVKLGEFTFGRTVFLSWSFSALKDSSSELAERVFSAR